MLASKSVVLLIFENYLVCKEMFFFFFRHYYQYLKHIKTRRGDVPFPTIHRETDLS